MTAAIPTTDAKKMRARGKARERQARWRERNPERASAYKASWKEKNIERVRSVDAAWVARNKDRKREIAAARYRRIAKKHGDDMALWRSKNRERQNALVAEWARKNPEKRAATAAHRRAMKLRATPAWANEFLISEIYDLARLRSAVTGGEWHVDHIVPLKSPLVCGLHVEHNLRVIPAQANLSKGSKLIEGVSRV
jgi:5-methylcytosine-specific restriction endonuclease McrA